MERIHSTDAINLSNFSGHMMNPSPLIRKRGGGAINEFREFALRGSVLDMAIGIILGVAFGKIISSFVEDMMLPLIGLLFGKVDFSNLFVTLTGQHFATLGAARASGVPTMNYGLFLNAIFNFVLVALGVFFLIRQVNRLRDLRADEAAMRECPRCFSAVQFRATRCPYCTSDIAKEAIQTGASGA